MGTNKKLDVDVSKLIVEKGLILIVPKELCNVVNDQVVFHDAVDEVLNAVMNRCPNLMCDEDMSLVLDADADVVQNPDEIVIPSEEGSGPSGECVRNSLKRMCQPDDDVDVDQLQTCRKKPAKRRQQILSDEEDDDNEIHF